MIANLIKLSLVLSLAIFAGQMATGDAVAAAGGVKGPPEKDGGKKWSVENPPPGIAKKDSASRPGKWKTTPDSNGGCPPDCPPSDNIAATASSNGVVAQIVCSTELDDEAMRVCLGLPPVKKSVRVKKLNVEFGTLQ